MEHENFKQAYFAEHPQAVAIGGALETAMQELDAQGIIELTSIKWWAMCSQAWAYYVAEQQG